ncbi:hypothetical protein [Sulfitobacter sp.]|uniref:hypothetical protein n=1 Tax=Sulfitobacter sp. TaxID=1903071 RepID=UPI0030035136
MDNDKEETGRKKVRAYFLNPLNEAGMVRKRTDTVEKHKKTMTALADKLAYMSPEKLRGLRQYVVRLASGKAGNVWPSEQSIERAAYDLQTPPPRKSDYAQSLVRSAMGQRANDEGWVVELFQIAKKIGPPPNRYIISKLKEEADDNRRRRGRVAEYIKSGSESPHDRAWLAQYHSDLDECLAIINDKSEKVEA